MTKQYTITVTENQARIILDALSNEANDDMVTRGEYSYWRCYLDMDKKLAKAGYGTTEELVDLPEEEAVNMLSEI